MSAPLEGLVGLFGHTYIPDPENADERIIQYQFRIVRKMEGERYVVQYYSCWDGDPTSVGVYSEAELLGPNVRLYLHDVLWRDAFTEENERWARRRRVS